VETEYFARMERAKEKKTPHVVRRGPTLVGPYEDPSPKTLRDDNERLRADEPAEEVRQ